MKVIRTRLQIVLVIAVAFFLTTAAAQKIKVGYDKSTDFSKFTTYSWTEPAMPPGRPLLYANIVSLVDQQLQLKGFTRTASNGDLTLTPAGGVDFGIAGAAGTPILPNFGGPPPAFNAGMWTGAGGPSTAGTYVPEGTLLLTFVDRATNTVIWAGSVKQTLDNERKDKSLELADKAVLKLLKQFPQRKTSVR